jgi:flavorubredoxin
MAKILIMYYTRRGNTGKMAKAIAEGARSVQGVEVEIKGYENPQRLVDYDAILIGTPTYYRNMTDNIKKILEDIAFHNISLKNKIGASFGSYGWSGEAPHLVNEVLENKFEMEVFKPPLRIRYAPDETGLEKCRNFGKKIAEQIK